jgi:hypothetical protein
MLPRMGPPETMIWEFPGEDLSWKLELDAFQGFVERRETPRPGLLEAASALDIVEEIYRKTAS